MDVFQYYMCVVCCVVDVDCGRESTVKYVVGTDIAVAECVV